MLEDLETKEPKVRWYYENLRKYGREGNNFTIVAGRHTETGEGTFVFVHDDSSRIAKAINDLSKRKHNERLSLKLYSKEADSKDASIKQKPNLSPVIPKSPSNLKDQAEPCLEVALIDKSPLPSHTFIKNLDKVIQKNKADEKSKAKMKSKAKEKEDKSNIFSSFSLSKNNKTKVEKNKKETKGCQDKSDSIDNYDKNQNDKTRLREPLAVPSQSSYEFPTCDYYQVNPELVNDDTIKGESATPHRMSVEKKPLSSGKSAVYEEVKLTTKAWRNHGVENVDHMESEFGLKVAELRKGNQTIETLLNSDEDEDDTYDKSVHYMAKKHGNKSDTSIYGIESGKEISSLQSENDEENQDVIYYNTVSNINTGHKQPELHVHVPQHTYEDVEIGKKL